MPEKDLTIGDVLLALGRRKLRFLLVAAVVFSGVIAALAFWPRAYQSEAKLFVKLGRESVTLDPTAAIGPTLGIQHNREVELNSVLEVLQSRIIAEKVVDELGADVILAGGAPGEPGEISVLNNAKSFIKQTLKQTLRIPEISSREAAVRTLVDSMSLSTPKLSSVVSIVATADTPQFAQRLADAYCGVFLDEYVRLHHSDESIAFFLQQETDLSASLAQAEQRLRSAKDESGLASIDGRRQTLEEHIAQAQASLQEADVELVRTRAIVAALKQQLQSTPETLVVQQTRGIGNAATDGMRQQLYNLEINERRLEKELTDNHPRLVAVKSQLADVRRILAEQDDDRLQEVTAFNDQHQELSLKLKDNEARLASLHVVKTTLTKQVAKLGKELTELNADELQIGRLKRDVEVLSASYMTHAQRREQARLDEALAAGKISNVRQLQPANLQERPTSPLVGLSLAIGVVLATVMGFASTQVELLLGVAQGAAARPSPEPAQQRLAGPRGLATVRPEAL